ncbi:catalase family peroxidase [Paenibacillus sp. WLX2291]|uniref:catalase family peroxidase n=1 Tax=Paenibacillus sp. WLX2291 TaxID=3296934 RepID=UPI003984444F
MKLPLSKHTTTSTTDQSVDPSQSRFADAHHTGHGDQLSVRAVDELEQLSGIHPGYRRAHASGQCYRAVFAANGEAAAWTDALHLQQMETEAIVRFSGSSTNPVFADLQSPAKGMAVRFALPDGQYSCLVGVTVPVFFARTPASFMDMITFARKVRAGQASWTEVLAEMAQHFGEAKDSLRYLEKLRPPRSYATVPYYCIHAYLLTRAEQTAQPVRFEWEPQAGAEHLSVNEARQQDDDYLEQEMEQRLHQHPAVFTLYIVLGAPDDPTDDPTVVWPKQRQRIAIGQLTITGQTEEPDNLVMDPTMIAQGIELSDDPILQFRRSVYQESWERRNRERDEARDS